MKRSEDIDNGCASKKKYDPTLVKCHLRGQWQKIPVRHGISTIRSVPSKFLRKHSSYNITDFLWRDVADRSSMEARFEAYKQDLSVDMDDDILDWAHEQVSGLFGYDSLKPLRLKEAIRNLPQGSSAGYPYLTKRSEVVSEITRDASVIQDAIFRGSKPEVYPCVASSRRVVRQKGKNKPRLVWGFPGAISALEARFEGATKRVLKNFKFLGCNLNWMDPSSWKELFKVESGQLVTLDYKGFDASVNTKLIRSAFSIYRQLFQLTDKEEKLFHFLIEYFIHTPLVFYNRIVQKHRGLPSGSCFTYIIGTIVNMLISYYCAGSIGYSIGSASRWSGDDSRVSTDCGINKFQYMREMEETTRELGVCIHPDKSSTDLSRNTDGAFLSREISHLYPNIRFNYEKAVGQVFIPENCDKSPEDVLNRIIGLSYAYGFDRKMYDLLSEAWRCVKTRHPTARAEADDRLLYKMRWLLNSDRPLDWEFKSFEFYHSLYFGYC